MFHDEVVKIADVFEMSPQGGWQVGVGDDQDVAFLFAFLVLEQFVDVLRCFVSHLLDDLHRNGVLS